MTNDVNPDLLTTANIETFKTAVFLVPRRHRPGVLRSVKVTLEREEARRNSSPPCVIMAHASWRTESKTPDG